MHWIIILMLSVIGLMMLVLLIALIVVSMGIGTDIYDGFDFEETETPSDDNQRNNTQNS